MKEILQEYGGFILSVVLIAALVTALSADGGFISSINDNISAQLSTITVLGN